MNEQSGFIPIDNALPRAVYSTLFLPEALPAKTAVVIVEPIAEEKRAAYRMLVRLARKLADSGMAAIRFDLSGTGDSTLPHADTSFSAWVEDTVAAAKELMSAAQTDQLAIVGARGGALVAAQAATVLKPKTLVFAEPVLAGGDFLFDLERRQNIKNMMSGGGSSETAKAQWEAGKSVDFGGCQFNPTLAKELGDASLANILPTMDASTAVHAIRVSASKKLPPAWSIFGDNTTIVADKPFWGQLDYYESDFVIDAVQSLL